MENSEGKISISIDSKETRTNEKVTIKINKADFSSQKATEGEIRYINLTVISVLIFSYSDLILAK